jgi:glycyl-tRNA synthetase beta chain
LKKKLCERVEDLKGITFQKGLGTMYDKCQRLVELSGFLADSIGNIEQKNSIQRTALLCKSDLLTNLVYEFTELEGFIGADYAIQTGETQAVAEGIKEHYFPLGADSETAKGIEGQLVGIVDKIDTIVTTFAVGKKPTGSADPLGIRRATLGVITTILNNGLKVDISKVIEKAISLAPIAIDNSAELLADIEDFFLGRFKIMLQQNFKYDLIDAVVAVGQPLADVCDVKTRLDLLKELSLKEDFSKFNDAINRIIRILKSADSATIQENLLLIEAEKSLYKESASIDENALTYDSLIKKLFELEPFISKFFDDVLVMDKDEAVKNNRIALLSSIKVKFLKLADFSKIVL